MTTQMDLKCLKKQGSSPKLYTLYSGVTLYTAAADLSSARAQTIICPLVQVKKICHLYY